MSGVPSRLGRDGLRGGLSGPPVDIGAAFDRCANSGISSGNSGDIATTLLVGEMTLGLEMTFELIVLFLRDLLGRPDVVCFSGLPPSPARTVDPEDVED